MIGHGPKLRREMLPPPPTAPGDAFRVNGDERRQDCLLEWTMVSAIVHAYERTENLAGRRSQECFR
jgi:hypothetical protein